MQHAARVENDARLAGVWLRSGTAPMDYAPVTIASGAPALCRVEPTYGDGCRCLARWEVYVLGGVLLDGALEPAAGGGAPGVQMTVAPRCAAGAAGQRIRQAPVAHAVDVLDAHVVDAFCWAELEGTTSARCWKSSADAGMRPPRSVPMPSTDHRFSRCKTCRRKTLPSRQAAVATVA